MNATEVCLLASGLSSLFFFAEVTVDLATAAMAAAVDAAETAVSGLFFFCSAVAAAAATTAVAVDADSVVSGLSF
mgnify:CR=1 FL=1